VKCSLFSPGFKSHDIIIHDEMRLPLMNILFLIYVYYSVYIFTLYKYPLGSFDAD